jgi:hypothetical protein
MAYTAGDAIKTRIRFEVDNVLTAPTAWSIYVQPPGAPKFELLYPDPSIVENEPGDYTWTQSTSFTSGVDHGQWVYVVVSAGVAQGARPGMFVVDEPPIAA